MQDISLMQVLARMREMQGQQNAKEFARQLGISAQYLSDVYKRRTAPGPAVLEALGLEKVTSYRKKT